MKLKICGMKYPENMKSVAGLQPDYLGFIFYEKSARYFEGEIPKLPENIKKTGVFVDASVEDIVSKIKTYGLDAVQLHGNESPGFCEEIRERSCETELIKVFSVKDEFDFSVLSPYENVVDYYLFDTKGKLPGGNGYAFNWKLLSDYPSKKPFFLSGGIGLEHTEKLKQVDPKLPIHAIDVNSKFEIAPGQKNIEQLKQFIDKVKI
ncbi:phosphoribosylanthranilate isomerase [Galbibacter sp. EGI 63066]|uniref:phosphoribosylanthranilate isomerase n=1 Tax=Galbibacter sp. EGI 63066 TaxID=2993559 RepID=UPI002248C6A6|nr:phosphoribosylanthranilate isomerase [Galbibacter sp. EGI 63066]MCX2679690.1 phosphoribosylanthranilate isomerase [Galbibacter sp. EGI 63066]